MAKDDEAVPKPDAEEFVEPRTIQLGMSRRDQILKMRAAQVIPAPGTVFLPTPPPPPVPPSPLPPPQPQPQAAAEPQPQPLPPPQPPDDPRTGRPLTIGGAVRQLTSDIRALWSGTAAAAPAYKPIADRALEAVLFLAAAINEQPPPEEFKPLLQRFFVVERELAAMQETLAPAIALGRELARDTQRPVVVAQAVIVLNHQREIREDWL